MTERDWMAERFEEHREYLRGVAYRVLGSASDADDAVQDAWLRVSRADTADVVNLRAWLTTIVARTSLNMLRSRNARRQDVGNDEFIRLVSDPTADSEHEAVLADSVGLALLVVLERLAPAERLAFVLHDMFDLPFEEIASIVGRTPTAARQLASRARRRVRGGSGNASGEAGLRRRREVVEAYLSASRQGNFTALLALLDPDAVLRVEDPRESPAKRLEVHGAQALIERGRDFSRAARFCRVALLDGAPGLVMAPRGRLARAIAFSFSGEKITGIEVISDPERLRRMEFSLPADESR